MNDRIFKDFFLKFVELLYGMDRVSHNYSSLGNQKNKAYNSY